MSSKSSKDSNKSITISDLLLIISAHAGIISLMLAFFYPSKGAALALCCISLTYTAKVLAE